MAIDADGNFYNPYSPGSYEYEMEEGTRGQEPGTGGVVTTAQTPDILRVQQPTPPAGFNTFNQITGLILSVATLSVPLLGEMIGASILEGLGVTGASAAVKAGVGAAALSAGSTAAQGGSVEDVLKAAAGAGAAAGLNIGMGGGITGAVTGSTAGTIIKGGDASQVLTNAFAAGVGAGVQGAMLENPDAGKIIGTAARTYIATGGNMDQTLLNTAASAIGTLDQPAKSAQQLQAASTPASDAAAQETAAREVEAVTQSDAARQQELADYQEKLNQYAIDKAIYEQTYGPIADQPPAAAPAAAPPSETALAPQTIAATAPAVAPVVTDLDLVKQVAAQPTPTVDPKALERVIVQGQGANVANVAPVETTVPSATVPSTATVATPTPTQPFPTPTIIPVAEPEKETPVVTDIPPVEPPQTEFEKKFISETVPAPVTTGPEFQQVTVRETVPPPVAPGPEFEQKTIRETVPKVSDVVTETPAPPPVAQPTELEKVTVTAKTMEPPPAPTLPPAPEVKAEEPKKEEPKKESKKLYPTVTSVPPPKKPGRQPIITGASPARLLADALAAYRPAGAIEGEESGKERQNVWNEKSLRLKDALGL
jgi:hypothetical protein